MSDDALKQRLSWDGNPLPDWRDCFFCDGRGTMRKPSWIERKLSISFSICPVCSGLGASHG